MAQRCPVCKHLMRPPAGLPRPTCERPDCIRQHRERLSKIPGMRACVICGSRADADCCGSPYCRETLDARARRDRMQRERLETRDATVTALDRELRRRTSARIPASAVSAPLPASDRPAVSQHPARKLLFAERLAAIVEVAEADPAGPTGDPAAPEQPKDDRDALARAGCASCRGLCCRLGEDHAFLRPATLRRYLRANPALSSAQAMQAYLGHVPRESIEGSCLYHGRDGCALPRALGNWRTR